MSEKRPHRASAVARKPAAAQVQPSYSKDESQSLEGAMYNLATTGGLDQAGRQAVQRQIDKGLPITFKRGNRIIKRYTDGREEVLGRVAGAKYRLPAGVRVIGAK